MGCSKYYKILVYLLTYCLVYNSIDIQAQNINFTNYANVSPWFNPAKTGFFFYDDIRVSFTHNVREISGFSNYQTSNITLDAKLFDNLFKESWVGIGAIALYDKGSATIRTQQFFFPFSYHQIFRKKHILSVGISPIYKKRDFDFSALRFGDQWDGEGYNLITTDVNFLQNTEYWDLQIGANYTFIPNKNFNFSIGASSDFVYIPQDKFSIDNLIIKSDNSIFELSPVTNLSVQSYYFSDNLNIAFINNYFSTIQNNTHQHTFISSIEHNISNTRDYSFQENNDIKLYLGIGSRISSSGIAMVGIKYKKTKMFFYYEGIFNALPNSLGYNNSIEFTLLRSFHIKRSTRRFDNRFINCAY